MKEAKKIAEGGKVKDYVHKFATTKEDYDALKPRPKKLTWKESGKDTWSADVPDEKVPARIRALDKKTWAVYRNGNYLGGEATREDAEMRTAINTPSERNEVMRLWDKNHPNELPPFVLLTDAERRLYWERNPPTRPAPRSVTPDGLPKEDAVTKRLREAVAQDGSGGRAGRAKLAKDRGDAAVAPEGTIRVLNATNPKKAGTGAHGRWALLFSHDGKSVKQFAEAKGNLTTLANAMAKGNVKVEK